MSGPDTKHAMPSTGRPAPVPAAPSGLAAPVPGAPSGQAAPVPAAPQQPLRRSKRKRRAVLRVVFGAMAWLLLTAYAFLTRFAVAVGAVWGVAYFGLASTVGQDGVGAFVSRALPGTVTVGALRWGPAPWKLDAVGVTLRDPAGAQVISVAGLRAELGLSRTLWSMVDFFDDSSKNTLTVYLAETDLLQPEVAVVADSDGRLGLLKALVRARSGTPRTDRGAGFRFEANNIRISGGAARVELGSVRLRADGVFAVTDLVVGSDTALSFSPGTVTVDAFRLFLDGLSDQGRTVRLDAHAIAVDGFTWRGERFDWQRVTAGVGEADAPEGWLTGEGGMDLEPSAIGWWGAAELALTPGADGGAAGRVTGGRAHGAGRVSVQGRGTLERLEAQWQADLAQAEVVGLGLGGLTAAGRFSHREDPEDPDVHAVLLDAATVAVAGGRLGLRDGSWEPGGVAGQPSSRAVAVAWDLDGLSARSLVTLFSDILSKDSGLGADLEAAVRGHGTLQVAEQAAGGGLLAVDLAGGGVEVKADKTSEKGQLPAVGTGDTRAIGASGTGDTRAIGASGTGATRALGAVVGRYALSGGARLAWGPPPQGAVTPRLELVLSGLQLDRGASRARLAGRVDLAEGVLDLEPYLRLGDLGEAGDLAGIAGLQGRLVLKEARLTGPMASPRVEGALNWTQAAVGDATLAQVKGRIRYEDKWLTVDELVSQNGLGEVSLDGRLQVADGWPFEVTDLRLGRLAIGRFLPELGEDARVDVIAERVSGRMEALGESLAGEATVTLNEARLAGERVAQLSAHVAVSPTRVALQDVSLKLAAPGTARSGATGGPSWSGALQLTRATGAVEGHVRLGATDLDHLRGLARADIGGRLEGDLALTGTLKEPHIRGIMMVRDLRAGAVRFGSGEVVLTPHAEGGVAFQTRDGSFAAGLAALEGHLALEAGRASSLRVKATLERFEPATLLPALASDLLRLSVTASAELTVDLARPRVSLTVAAPVGGLILSAPTRGKAWDNRSPLLLTGDGRALALDPIELGLKGGAGAPVALCGRLEAGAVGPGGTRSIGDEEAPWNLEARVAGLVDLALIPGLDEALSRSEGSLAIVEPEASGQSDLGTCFHGPRSALELSGPPTAPRLRGAVSPRGVAFVPRGSGLAVRLSDGARVDIAADARDVTTLSIPRATPLRAELDEGSVAVHGVVSLRGLRPADADLALVATDVVARGAGAFELTASADGRLRARDLASERPTVALSGRVDISEARFFKSFDVISQALGGAFGGAGDVYARSALDGLPWLKETRLDLEVAAQDLLISSALPLARTNLPARLDLSVRGTLGQPELYRRVDLVPGGQLTYLVFERTFRIVTGAIDFDGDPATPLIDITGQTAIPYLARASNDSLDEDERVVTVTLRVTGRVPDLKIELFADDGTLDQADIQALLLTGKPRGDLDRAEESRVVSADLSTMLNGVLAAPFLRTASVGLGQKGALEYRVGTCLAPNLCFDTTTIAGDTETTLRARFSLALGDQLVCEGTLRRSDTTTVTNQQTYQARCRYRVPLR